MSPRATTRFAAPLQIEWGDVQTTDGCFFFSGPEGRDNPLTGMALLEEDGERVRLTIGDAEFVGAQRGGTADLIRVSPHDFGSRWLAFESLHGSYHERAMTMRYRYRECQADQACPGRCVIAGDVTFIRP